MQAFMAELVLGFAIEVPGVFNIQVTLEFSDIQCLLNSRNKLETVTPATAPTAPSQSPAVPSKGDIHKAYVEQQQQQHYQQPQQQQQQQQYPYQGPPLNQWGTIAPPDPSVWGPPTYSPALPGYMYNTTGHGTPGLPPPHQPNPTWNPRPY